MIALAPGIDDDVESNEFLRLQTPRALQRLKRLDDAGLLQADAAGTPVVPVALRGAVARGVILAMLAAERGWWRPAEIATTALV